MTTLNRLKTELGKDYFADDVLEQYLQENNLEGSDKYNVKVMKRDLLTTVLDILQALCNDLELFRSIQTEYSTTGEAYSALQKRLLDVERRINAIPDPNHVNNVVSYLFHG